MMRCVCCNPEQTNAFFAGQSGVGTRESAAEGGPGRQRPCRDERRARGSSERLGTFRPQHGRLGLSISIDTSQLHGQNESDADSELAQNLFAFQKLQEP